MSCLFCPSKNQAEFAAEMIIHFRGLKNLDKPGVRVYPRLLVCSDCGYSRFTVPATELALLAGSIPASESSTLRESVDHVALRRGNELRVGR